MSQEMIRLIPLTPENRQAAEQNMVHVNALLRPHMRDWSQRLTTLVNSKLPVAMRMRGLYKVAGEITDLAAPHSVCKRGCSACCHMATLVSLPEAEMIAKAVGVKMRMPKRWPFFSPRTGAAMDARDDFAASFHAESKPCTFLVNNECSIYEHRPLACRIHLNMGANAEPCQMDAARETAMLNLHSLDDAYAMIGRTTQLQDIREYFPHGARR